MKTRSPSTDLALRCLPAVLLAVHFAAFGMPGQARAQSATPAGSDDNSASATFDRTSSKLSTTTSSDQQSSDDQDADPNDPDTSAVPDPDAEEVTDATLDAAALKELRQQNDRVETVDGLRPKLPEDPTLTPGIAVGTMTFRPTISESLGTESTTTGKDTTTRTYLQTGFKGSLVSDWSLHQLKIDAEGTWAKTLSGIPDDNPEGSLNAELRLDLSNDTVARLKAGYSLQREDVSDPNAISDAENQAQVSTYTATAEVTHDLGLIRGTAGIDFTRETYGEATLQNGTLISQSDRDNNEATVRGRLGYELSPALIPFIEASYGQVIYDNHQDSLGFVRDATLYALKAGVEGDFGDKLRGEISTGLARAEFEDDRLKAISAWTVDGNATWSPQRGTDVLAGLKTEIEPSTSAGASGDVAYTANVALTQVIIEQLSGRLSTTFTWRDYSEQSVPQQTVLNVGAGVTWGLSRSIDLTTDLTWERTQQSKSPNQEVFTGLVGIAFKR